MEQCVEGVLRPASITDREKVTEEKEKDKEMLAAAEPADAKAKSEVLDLKKGVSEGKVATSTHSRLHLHQG